MPINRRLYAIDLLRLIAALMVVLFHYAFELGNPHQIVDSTNVWFPSIPFAKYGYLGVNIFFVISGFVIAYSVSEQRPAVYAWHRWIRIYPTYFACLLITTVVVLCWGLPHEQVSTAQFLGNLLIVSHIAGVEFVDPVYWTISCEVWFYAAVFLGILFKPVRRKSTYILIAWLAISTIDQIVTPGGRLPGPLMTPFASLFCTGIFLYRVHYRRESRVLHIVALSYSICLSLFLSTLQAKVRFGAVHADFSLAAVVIVAFMGIAVVSIAPLVSFSSRYKKLAIQLGALTYPLYLLHDKIGAIFIRSLHQSIGDAATALGAFAVSLAGARFIASVGEPWMRRFCLRMVWKLPKVAKYVGAKPLAVA